MACQARGLPRSHCHVHEEMLKLKSAGMYWPALGSNVVRDSGSTDQQRVAYIALAWEILGENYLLSCMGMIIK